MRVTLGDVAENAGVSQATASRVLNGRGGVAHGTRSAVISAARHLGYERGTRQGRVIGVVLPELVNPIFATFGHRFATSLAQSGYTPVLCSQTVGGVSEDDWVEMLLEREMAGLIVVSGHHADTHAGSDRYQRLIDRHIPLVLVNGHVRRPPGRVRLRRRPRRDARGGRAPHGARPRAHRPRRRACALRPGDPQGGRVRGGGTRPQAADRAFALHDRGRPRRGQRAARQGRDRDRLRLRPDGARRVPGGRARAASRSPATSR